MAEESIGEIVSMLYGAIGGERGRPIILLTDSEGRLDTLANLRAVSAAGDRVDLRTDNQRLLRNRPYESLRRVATAAITGAWATYYTAPASSVVRVTVQLGTAAAGDLEASLRVQGTIQITQIPVYGSAPGPKFTYVIEGAEIVEAVRTSGAGGVIMIDAEVYSTGDEHTGV